MLKTSKSTKSATRPEKGVIGVGSNSKARYDRNKLDKSEIDDGEIGGNEVDNKVGKKG